MIIACTQDSIAPDECPECGGWLHHEVRGGYSDGGFRYCSEECIDNYQSRAGEVDRRAHLHCRDLMCRCEWCTADGHPTASEVAEYHAYLSRTPKETTS